MELREVFLEAIETLRKQRLRSALSMFGVIWGTAAVVFLLSWGLGVQKMLETGFLRVGKNLVVAVPGFIGKQYNPARDRRKLWFTLDDVKAARKRSRLAASVAGETGLRMTVAAHQATFSMDVRGIEPQQMELRGVRIRSGRPISRNDVASRRRVAVLGYTARRRLLGPEGGIGSSLRINGQPFRVIGLLDRVGTQLWRDGATELDEQIWIPIRTMFSFGQRRGRDRDIVDAIEFEARDRHQFDALRDEIRSILSQRLDLSVGDEAALHIYSPIEQLRKLPIDQSNGVLLILGATTLLIGGISILNMMLDSVQERRQEIGIRMAVGARRRDLLRQFFLETLIITGIGGGLGLAFGLGGCWLLTRFETPDLIPIPIVRAEIAWLAIGLMGTVGICAGLIPAWRASRVDPSITLRGE